MWLQSGSRSCFTTVCAMRSAAVQVTKSFNGKFRDELLNGEIFDTILEARILTERWRREYNTIRPHSSLGYRPPAPEAFQPLQLANA